MTSFFFIDKFVNFLSEIPYNYTYTKIEFPDILWFNLIIFYCICISDRKDVSYSCQYKNIKSSELGIHFEKLLLFVFFLWKQIIVWNRSTFSFYFSNNYLFTYPRINFHENSLWQKCHSKKERKANVWLRAFLLINLSIFHPKLK